jgi:hypothetical protein
MTQTPTTEQLQALKDFARLHGRTWKSQLRESWMSGIYPFGVDTASLQQVRNGFGPSWLVRFSLKEASETFPGINAMGRRDLTEGVKLGWMAWPSLTTQGRVDLLPRLTAMEERLRRLDATEQSIEDVTAALRRSLKKEAK